MNRRFALLAGIAALLIAAGPVSFAVGVDDIVNQVSQAQYRHYLDDCLYTHYGDDRGWGPEHDLCRSFIYNELAGFGLQTTLHPFTYSGSTYYNVVAVQPGAVRPDEIYIVAGHYDSVNNPGADDNASGITGTLEAARILSHYQFEATIIYIGFDREEQGLIGSNAYATEHQDDNIMAMISMDMIAYNNGNNSVDLYGRSTSNPLKYALRDAIWQYGNGLGVELNDAFDASDHAPFEWQGFQACLMIEDWGNPYYHSQMDSVDTPNYIDYVLATNMTRSTVGYLATAAGLVPEPSMIGFASAGILFLAFRLRRRAIG
jgi:Zn-dependent M28 family amino/carboxypeptidase